MSYVPFSHSGLVYNRARYLHPTLGTFTRRDAAGYIDGLNLYEYVAARSIIAVDPNGNALATPPQGSGCPGGYESDGAGGCIKAEPDPDCNPAEKNGVCLCQRAAFSKYDPLLNHAYLWWSSGSCGKQGYSGTKSKNPAAGGGAGPPTDKCWQVLQSDGQDLTAAQAAAIRACICTPATANRGATCWVPASDCITNNGGEIPRGPKEVNLD